MNQMVARRLLIIAFLVVVFGVFVYYFTSSNEQSVQEDAVVEVAGYPITLRDASGMDVTLNVEPKRIVSLAPSETETLFALGLSEQIVGVTEWCDYPEQAKEKAKVGDMTTNVEAILAMKPDLVVAGYTINKDAVEKLRDLGMTVYATEPKTIEQVQQKIESLGKLTNRQTEATEIVGKMTTEQELVRKALESVPDSERLNVYLEFDPLWTVGTGEFGHDLIQLAKGRNIAESMESWVQVNDEFVIKANPDVIVFGSYAGVNPETANAISQRSGWSNISAVSNRRIVGLDANLISRPGPRITTGLHELAKAIYPELVK